MPTAAQYGMGTPVGTDLIREGDNEITRNANAAAVVFTRLESGRFKPQLIPTDSDLDTLEDGYWFSRSSTLSATILNKPEGVGDNPFDVFIRTSKVGSFVYRIQEFNGYSGSTSGYYKRNTSNATGSAFIPWRRLDNEDVGASGLAGVANALRVQEFRDAMGPINTRGLGAISFRFDHGLTNFNSKMRGPLDAKGFKYSLALSSRAFNVGENAGVTAAMVNGWPRAEVWNHGANSHQDESTLAGLTDQIVTGKAELQAALPSKPIWGYAVPGTGGTGQGGFGGGSTPEAFYATAAGDLILTNHAVSSGAFSGTARRILDGEVRQGMAHFTIEAQTVARIKTEIDSAISNRTGNQLMMHPSLLDSAGYLTTAQFVEVLDYAASKVAAGQLVVLSPYEMLVADSRPGLKVSQAAGRVITAWDYLNNREQMIYGDTGHRSIPVVGPGVDGTGEIWVRRQGNVVTMTFFTVVATASLPNDYLTDNIVPVGFRPQYALNPVGMIGNVNGNGSTPIGIIQGAKIRKLGAGSFIPGAGVNALRGQMTWDTVDPWPDTLPGVAVGTIPA